MRSSDFLSRVHEPVQSDAWAGITRLPDSTTTWLAISDTDWQGVDVVCLWADVDAAGPNGKKKRHAPASLILDTLRKMPLQPSLVVATGGGYHPYWLLDEVAAVTDAAPRLKAWEDTIRTRLGYEVDSVHDMPRMMRLPGSWNMKYEKAHRVYVMEGATWRRYSIGQFPLASEAPHDGEGAATGPITGSVESYIQQRMKDDQPFRERIRRERSLPSGDTSGSAYDLAIASTLAHEGMCEQDVRAICREARRMNGDDVDKIDRSDYWDKTWGKAKQTNRTAVGRPQRTDDEKTTIAEQLMRIALDEFRFGRDDMENPFAAPLHGPNLALPLSRSNDSIHSKLACRYRDLYGKPPAKSALNDAIGYS